ncbi:SET domain-containing protein [Puia sp. P3]|uniref:SET domain-containing protein n=1 Tax=Puia sp. P3 TaxID=3423952 RepID=UPI003D67AA89
MPLLEKQLVVKRSTLKGAGKGLFTTRDIPRGKKIVEYKGKVTTWKEAGFPGWYERVYLLCKQEPCD